MLQSVILGFGVAMAAGLAVAVAVKYFVESARHSSQTTFYEPRDPDITNMPTLGNCSYCTGAADALNGYILPCNHPIHYTCAAYMKGVLRGSRMLCKICVASNLRELGEGSTEGIRDRESRFRRCVNCDEDFTKNAKTLSCSHQVHESCWHRMQENSTPCAGCARSRKDD